LKGPKKHIKIKTEPDFSSFIFDNIFDNSVGKLHRLPSSKREGRRRLALHSAAICRVIDRFAVEMDRDSDFTFGVCVAARPGNLGMGAGALENFTSGQGPPKFGLPLIAS